MKFTAIAVYVNDINLALEFYTNKLDFEVSRNYGPKIVSLVHSGVPFIVQEVNSQPDDVYVNTSSNILIFETDNLISTVKTLKEKGLEFIREVPEDCPPGQYVAFKDPFGNIFEVVEFKK